MGRYSPIVENVPDEPRKDSKYYGPGGQKNPQGSEAAGFGWPNNRQGYTRPAGWIQKFIEISSYKSQGLVRIHVDIAHSVERLPPSKK